ncbi:MAG: hypothetical protein HETSPECPRED_005310 [Heterodermia speciosa]|uniref:Uncharacterized protein n=1 Tax=Heterodermia speciosa TaxID=116794 RepID=A0A8H3FDR3_9LECA|nr:MAG: hypothetical protein HETSPECPRED_005310 [Heterodermia speciosa]
MNPALPAKLHMSPKRKRSDYSLNTPPPTSRLKTSDLPPDTKGDLEGERSPRTAVAGHLQSLDLGDKETIPAFKFRSLVDGPVDGMKSHGGFGNGITDMAFSLDTAGHPSTKFAFSSGPSAHPPPTPPHEPNSALEIPETPRLKPVSSPLPSPGSKSPPGLWWSDAEITGHDPKDPSDDGYGINGVGFIPTPAVANARVERRKKQIAEWKNREAKEARQKRSDRRRRRDMENEATGTALSSGSEGRKVRFLET